jgi:methylated-DNA-[protein]-cysteine S-methyltransferase
MDPLAQPAKADSEFATRVYRVVSGIPPGRVATYRAVAEAVGCRSPRAVGSVLRSNPYAPSVPCHRVISSSGQVGGFFGSNCPEANHAKMEILRSEGVAFTHEGIVDPACILRQI